MARGDVYDRIALPVRVKVQIEGSTFRLALRVYGATVRGLKSDLGYRDTPVYISDPDVLDAIHAHAQEMASSIVDSVNAVLKGKIDRQPDGLSDDERVADLSPWLESMSDYAKETLVSSTRTDMQDQATRDFTTKNGLPSHRPPEDALWDGSAEDVTKTLWRISRRSAILRFKDNPYHDQLGRFTTAELAVQPSFHDLPEGVQGKILAKADAVGLPLETVKNNMEAIYQSMTPDEIARYKDWYSTAHDCAGEIAKKYGFSEEQTTAVLAVLSPLRNWNGPNGNKEAATGWARIISENQPFTLDQQRIDDFNAWSSKPSQPADTRALAGTVEPGIYHPSDLSPELLASLAPQNYQNSSGADSIEKTIRVLRGDPVEDVVSGPKVTNFYNNIANPDDEKPVTIDTWMLKAAAGDTPIAIGKKGDDRTMTWREWGSLPEVDGKETKRGLTSLLSGVSFTQNKEKVYDGGLYAHIARAVTENADKHDLLPNQYQAIIWGKIVQEDEKRGGYGASA